MIAEKFKEHIVFERLEQLKSRLQEDEVREKISIEWLSFYDSVVEYISERLNTTFPILIQEAELNALANEIASGLAQINSFLGNNNTGHLNNANNNFITALNRVRNFPLPIPKSKFNFSKEIANFETVVSEKYKLLENKNKEINQKISKLNSLLTKKQNEIDKLNQLLAQKQNEINNLSTNFKAELNNIKTAANQQFEQEKNKFRQEFDAEKQNFIKEKELLQESLNKEREKYETEIEELKNKISQNTSDIVEELKTKLEESKRLVNIIGNVGATGNYQKIADYHKKQANMWRWIALSFMIVLIALLIWTIYHITGGEFNWKVAVVRIVAFSALLYPATYAAKESGKHRRLENLNRKYELDLASINPFIEILPEEKKQEIKEKMVEKFFGNNEGLDIKESRSKDDEVSISAVEKLVKVFLPFFNK
jgi:hypothetical protein